MCAVRKGAYICVRCVRGLTYVCGAYRGLSYVCGA